MQIEFIEALQQFRSHLLDLFFKGLNFFDTPVFFFILLPALWFGKSWKVSMRLFAIVLLSTLSVNILKDFFAYPRPFHLFPKLAVIHVAGYGFPSGGATTAMLLSTLLVTYGKSKWKWAIGLAFLFFISLSRLYLGVHFLIDVLGGWILGLLLWALFVFTAPNIESYLKKCPRSILFLISQIIPLLLSLCYPSSSFFVFCTISMGLSIGLFINYYYRLLLHKPTTKKEAILRGIIGAVTSLILFAAVKQLPVSSYKPYLLGQALIVGLGISIGGTLLCRKLVPNSKK